MKDLLQSLGVRVIVHLDDLYGRDIDQLIDVHRLALCAKYEVDPDSVFGDDELKDHLKALGPEEIQGLRIDYLASEEAPAFATVDHIARTCECFLRRIAPDVDLMTTVSRISGLLEDYTSGSVLLILDQELASPLSSLKGTAIAEALGGCDALLSMFILTHGANSEQAEADFGHSVAFCSKKEFDHSESGFENFFRQRLCSSLIYTHHTKIRDEIRQILDSAMASAFAKLESITADVFENVVMSTSHAEGAWVADQVLRLFQSSFSHSMLRTTRSNPQLHLLSSRVSKAYQKPSGSKRRQFNDFAYGIQRGEIYFTDITGLGMETQAGDFYYDEASRRYWALIEQGCDLAIRSDGLRDKHFDVDRKAYLAQVICRSKKEEPPELGYELKCFSEISDSDRWFVQFKNPALLPLWILDLAVVNPANECRIGSDSAADVPLTPSWEKRLEFLKRYADTVANVKRMADAVANLESDSQGTLHSDIACMASGVARLPTNLPWPAPQVSVNKDDWNVEFGLRRVFRLVEHYATELIQRKSIYMMRWAHARPWTDG